ncbi:calcium/calmodulin-dependent protein kinase [Ephemerocybe angulata]|uniref:Calcium/calmodulin-dependent protein kinase n=1 Tax=Ephemerocybe angulata TaxID=980116 RepID=A0A8H6HDR5_9AGAR|nr:calcium/calmodulin-dependent protein kinase [Tulosesus angulatus]
MGAGQSRNDGGDAGSTNSIDRLKRYSRAFKKPRDESPRPGAAKTQTPPATTTTTTTTAGAAAAGTVIYDSSHKPPQATTASSSTPKTQDPFGLNMPPSSTVPCQYRTGKTLGSGTYAIVKEAIHITTGKYYACKVINKKLMEGREHMVRNEIAVLKRISSSHPNIVTLHDYFETAHNLYLCFDLCTGGELFDRICAKGNYYEADAAGLVRTIFKAVKYIHEAGIVHRDLKPENLLFKTQAEDADIMIADFGLSRVMDDSTLSLLTEICGTPGYMAPEIFKRTGHSKPVDVWAMGVITYFLLAGYTPFDRDSQDAEMQAIVKGDYKYEPEEYWANVSETAKDFVSTCLTVDPAKRPTAAQALKHKWLADEEPHFVQSADGKPADLLPNVKRNFNAKAAWRKAGLSVRALNRMQTLAGHGNDAHAKMRADLDAYKAESEKENIETASITYQQKHSADPSVSADELAAKVANASIKDDRAT